MADAADSHISYLRHSPTVAALHAALVEAQGKFGKLKKDRAVEVSTRGGGAYSFRYATLDETIGMLRPVLSDCGLAFLQPIVPGPNGGLVLVTRIQHRDGEWMEAAVPLPDPKGDYQAFGSAVTYFKRYSITAFLGITSDEDDDGNRGVGNTVTRSQDRGSKNRPASQAAGPEEETFAFLLPNNETATLRAKEGRSAHERWVAAAEYHAKQARAGEQQPLLDWWEKQKKNLDALRAKHPGAAAAADNAVRARAEEIAAATQEEVI